MTTHPPYILTLDIGTSSVRALLYDARANLLPGVGVQLRHAPRTTPDGGVEFDAEELCARCVEAIDEAHTRLMQKRLPVAAVAMDTFVGNLLAVDESGKALTPVFTYADTRAAEMVPRLRAMPDEASAYQRVGVPFHTAYWSPQLLWLRESQPDVFRSAWRWLSFGDYLLHRLTGRYACSYSVASWTGMLDRFGLAWDRELMAATQIDEGRFSPLVGARFAFTELRAEYAARWRGLSNARWFPAVSDGVAANIGSGCFDETSAAVTIGTTAAVRVVVDGAPSAVPRGLWCYRVDERRSLLGGALSEGGNVVAWLRELLGEAAPGEPALGALPPDAHALTFLPLIAGERAPGWRADARAVLAGLSLTTTPAELLHAGMEGVALRLGLVWQLLRPTAPRVAQVVGSGGGLLSSPLWMQIIADVLNQPLAASAEPEATSRGTALLALEAMGILSLAPALFQTGALYAPNPQRHQVYVQAMQRQQALYRLVFGD